MTRPVPLLCGAGASPRRSVQMRQKERHAGRRHLTNPAIDAKDFGKKLIRQYVAGLSLGDEPPGLQDDEMVRIGGGEVEIVHIDEGCNSRLRELTDMIHQHQLMSDVELSRRLIKESGLAYAQSSTGQKLAGGAGELHALLFAAR